MRKIISAKTRPALSEQSLSAQSRRTFPDKDLVLNHFARYFFLLAMFTVLGLFFWIISPFIHVLIYASLIAIVFYPLYGWLRRKLRFHESIAAFLTTATVAFIVLAPLSLFSYFLVLQAVDAYELLDQKLLEMDLSNVQWTGAISDLPIIGDLWISISTRYGLGDLFEGKLDVLSIIQDWGQAVTTFIVSQAGTIAKSLSTIVVTMFILLLTTFFFFRDGLRIADFLKSLSPLPEKYDNEIELKLRDSTYAIVMGNFATAFLQGAVAAIGFAIAGVENIIFWGTLMSFTSLIPYVGASLIWLPVSLAFFIQGQFGWGLFIFIWGLGVVSVIDNFFRPIFIGNRTKMHPLATFLAVLGGIFMFGINGIIFGPLILSLTVTILHIYKLEYHDVLRN